MCPLRAHAWGCSRKRVATPWLGIGPVEGPLPKRYPFNPRQHTMPIHIHHHTHHGNQCLSPTTWTDACPQGQARAPSTSTAQPSCDRTHQHQAPTSPVEKITAVSQRGMALVGGGTPHGRVQNPTPTRKFTRHLACIARTPRKACNQALSGRVAFP